MCKSNKFCCCGCSLKTGVITIVIIDLICAIISMFVSLGGSMSQRQREDQNQGRRGRGELESEHVAYLWLQSLLLTIRVLIGQISISGGYTTCLKATHFSSHLAIDGLILLLFYTIYGATNSIRAFNLLNSIAFAAMNSYFLYVLYQFWKKTPDGGYEASDNVNQDLHHPSFQYPIEGDAKPANANNYSSLQNDPASKPQSEVDLGAGIEARVNQSPNEF